VGRFVLPFIAVLVCTAGSSADPTAAAQSPPSYCDSFAPRPMAFDSYRDRADLVAWRQSVSDFVTSTNSYLVCLYSALAAQKANFAKSGHAVDPVVEQAVSAFAGDSTIIKIGLVSSFNTAADSYNRQRKAGEDKVEPLDLSPDPPSPDSRIVLPPGSGLSMPARALDGTQNCDAFFPSAVRIHHREGSATIGYDIAADGSIANAQVLASSGTPEVGDAALDCVTTQWRNTPAIRDGIPFATTGYVVTISFATSHRVGN